MKKENNSFIEKHKSYTRFYEDKFNQSGKYSSCINCDRIFFHIVLEFMVNSDSYVFVETSLECICGRNIFVSFMSYEKFIYVAEIEKARRKWEIENGGKEALELSDYLWEWFLNSPD